VAPLDQWTRRTNPQIWQVASPVAGSTSRKLGQPLVPQKSRELAAAPLRRRIRRIADARPVTADVVERFIMVVLLCFLARRDRGHCDRLRGRGVRPVNRIMVGNDGVLRCLRLGRERGFWRSNRDVASDWLLT
jgi:hypothetical protein